MGSRTGRLFAGLGVSALLWVCFRGCMSEEVAAPADLTPVRGAIVRGGKALELRDGDFGKVWFHPDAAKGNTSSEVPAGDIGADGSYALFTRGHEGAAPGWYRVAIVVNRVRDPKAPNQKRKSLIPGHLADARTSGIALRVQPGQESAAYEIRLAK
jgi:hypothetical protein